MQNEKDPARWNACLILLATQIVGPAYFKRSVRSRTDLLIQKLPILLSLLHSQVVPKGEAVLVKKMDDLTIAVKGGLGEMQGEMTGGLEGVMSGLGEVKGGLSRVEGEVTAGFQKVESGLDEVRGTLDKVTASVQETLMRIESLQAPNFPYPHLVAVRKVQPGGASSRTTKKRTLLSSLRGVGTKEMTLRFLCPVDMSEVPCGFAGEGYPFRKARDWVKKLSPVLQVGYTS